MTVDLSKMDPAEKAQAQMFLTMVQGMPTDALAFFISLLTAELESRDN